MKIDMNNNSQKIKLFEEIDSIDSNLTIRLLNKLK
jgi:hypothetical protein